VIYNKFFYFTKICGIPTTSSVLGSGINVYITNSISQSYVNAGNLTLPDLTYFQGTCVNDGLTDEISGTTYNTLISNILVSSIGGSTGPFRYIVIGMSEDGCFTYPSNGDLLICYFDYGYSITLQDGESLAINFKSGKLFSII
jgi:hypothetical protein